MKGGIGSIRWGALLFSVPYTLLWTGALDADGREASATLLVIAHGAATLWGFALSDKVDVSRAVRPRLGALPRTSLIDSDPPAFAVAILTFFAVLPTLVLLLLDWRVGFAVLTTLVGMALFATSSRRRKFALAEVLLPLIILVAPAVVIGAGPRWTAPPTEGGATPAVEEGTPVIVPALFSEAIFAATWLGAVILGLIIVLCMLRDRPRDRADGLRTIASRSEGGARFVSTLWLAGAVTLAAMGAGWGWWHWGVGAIAAIVGAWSAAAMATADWRAAALRWTVGHAPIALALVLSAG